MGRAKQKKASEFESRMTRSVFLYGKPNNGKTVTLRSIQSSYTDEVNRFIRLLYKEKSLLPVLVKKDRHSSELRTFEKRHRSSVLNAAYSQSAFDMAVDHLYNRITEIRHDLNGIMDCPLTRSSVLFAMTVTGKSRQDMVGYLEKMISVSKKNKPFYQTQLDELPDSSKFQELCTEVRTLYAFLDEEYKIPHVGKARVRIVSTLFTLKESDGIQAPYVIEISDPANRGSRISVPLYGSTDAIRRLKQYKANATVDFSVCRDNETLRVAVSFDKHLRAPKVKSYRGVDVGITDMLHTADGKAYGTFSECEKFYKENVEPSFAGISGLRNKKRNIRHFLCTHKDALSAETVKTLRDKMDLLEAMMRSAKAPYHKRNHYNNIQDHAIKEAVDAYLSSLPKDKSVCTVLELLDIREFKKASRHQNQHLSNFARGKLSAKLMSTLNWHGFSFLQVDPAFTSQECPVCHHAAKENRSGKRFSCQCCGYTDDADHVGAVNIGRRAEDEEIMAVAENCKYNSSVRHAKIRALIVSRHEAWLKKQKDPAGTIPAV